jgi:hypothetical protein
MSEEVYDWFAKTENWYRIARIVRSIRRRKNER